jgi:hypothetical protein
MPTEPTHAALVWQQEALAQQIESTALWRAQRSLDHPAQERNDRASALLSDLAVHVSQLEAEHGLFDALYATGDDLRASEIVSERLWRYGFDNEIDPAVFVDALAAELTTLRETSESSE